MLVVGWPCGCVPIAAVAAWRGPDDTLTEMGWFFSQAALITFGGAYAVLSYVNVAAVSRTAGCCRARWWWASDSPRPRRGR